MINLSEIRDKKCPIYDDNGRPGFSGVQDQRWLEGFDLGVAEYSKLLRIKVEKDIDELTKLSSEDYGYNEALDMCRAFLEYIEDVKT